MPAVSYESKVILLYVGKSKLAHISHAYLAVLLACAMPMKRVGISKGVMEGMTYIG